MDAERTRAAMSRAQNLLAGIQQWEHSVIEPPMRELAVELGLKPGQLFGSIRVAISGRTATPPLFQMMEVLGRERTMQRIEQAICQAGLTLLGECICRKEIISLDYSKSLAER